MMSVLVDRAHSAELIPFLPLSEQPLTKAALERLMTKTQEEKKQILLDELKRLWVDSQRSVLGDVHPDWIVRALSREEPRMISTILRYLPSDKALEVLSSLPENKLKALPNVTETFSIDSELALILKKRFEENFARPLSSSRKRLSFESLHLLSPLHLRMLFLEIGFREMAFALTTLHENTVAMILNRLKSREARMIKDRMKPKGEVPRERLKMAQGHLLSLDFKKQDPETLIMETGFFVYSKAVLPQHLPLTNLVCQKFSRKTGELLRHYVDKNLPLNTPQTVSRYGREIVEAAQSIPVKDLSSNKE